MPPTCGVSTCPACCRRIDYDEFAKMMLTDEHERQQRPSEGRTHNKTHSRQDGGHAPAALPGSPNQASEHHSHHPHRMAAPRSGSNGMHVIHGVKSGAWGLQSQTGIDFAGLQQH
jgi:hypothetical protein